MTNTGTFQHDKILLDFAIVRESSHGINRLVSNVIICSSIVLYELAIFHFEPFAHSVDFLVNLCTMVVTFLASSGHSILDSAWMPSSDTSHLPQALVSFTGQFLGMPTGSYTFESMTLCYANNINAFIHAEDITNRDLLLKVLPGKIDFVGNASTIQLDLHNVSFLLPAPQNLHLGMHDDSDNRAVLGDLLQVLVNLFLAQVIGPLRARLGEGLLLGLRPVLVETTLAFLSNVFSPDSLEGAHAAWGVDVTNNANTNNWRSLQNGDCLDNFFFIDLGSRPVDLTNNVSHTSFVAHETG